MCPRRCFNKGDRANRGTASFASQNFGLSFPFGTSMLCEGAYLCKSIQCASVRAALCVSVDFGGHTFDEYYCINININIIITNNGLFFALINVELCRIQYSFFWSTAYAYDFFKYDKSIVEMCDNKNHSSCVSLH